MTDQGGLTAAGQRRPSTSPLPEGVCVCVCVCVCVHHLNPCTLMLVYDKADANEDGGDVCQLQK